MARAITVVLKTLLSLMKVSTEFLETNPRRQNGTIDELLGLKSEARTTMIEIELKRFCYHPEGTLGVIEFAGETFYSIERPWLDNAPNVSCIPVGSYDMGWRDSPRFGETWHVQEVQDRTYILIHAANFPKDVQGCIGLGTGLMGDRIAVSNSRKAVARFEELTRDVEWRLIVKNAQYAAMKNL
jgi:hypothetical protein